MGAKANKSHYDHLKEKWTNRHRALQTNLWTKHKDSLDWISKNLSPKQLAVSSLSGLLMLAAPHHTPLLSGSHTLTSHEQTVKPIDKSVFVVSNLSQVLPSEMRPLTIDEEQKAGEILTRDYGIKVTAELDGKKLNRSYGLIGQEQHLMRYPGDTMATHFDTEEEAKKFGKEGMAPGRGAWGYFAYSKEQMTEKDKLHEKYYIAVQTFLAPGFLDNVKEYVDFFKYRKMLVVNPQNGHAMVVVIGDAGPAAWTGKHLGGSPEVMRYLERVDGRQRGPVLYFFIDDPDDTIPLGPIELK